MAWNRHLAAGFVGIAAVAAALGTAELASAPPPESQRTATPTKVGAEIVVFAPPDRPDPASAASVLEETARALGARPRVVLDARRIGEDGVAARLSLEADTKKTILGDLAAPGAITVPIDARPESRPPTLAETQYSERIPSGRAASLILLGRSLEAALVTLAIDGGKPAPVEARAVGDAGLEISLPPTEPGRHRVEVRGEPNETPIRFTFDAVAPPRVLVAGSTTGLVARALKAQGFEIAPIEGGDLDKAAGLLVSDPAAPFARIRDAVRGGAGCLLVGSGVLEAAARSELAELLPAKARPAPPVESQPSKEGDGDPPDPNETPAPPPPDLNPKKDEPPKPDAPPGPATGTPTIKKGEEDAPVVALAIAIDRSGSMSIGEKMTLAKQAALASAQLLAPDDFIAILSFDTLTEVNYQLAHAGALDLITRKVEGITIGGGTAFYNALVEATNQLERVRLAARHVILITDGATQDRGDPRNDYRALLRERFNAENITLSTVFISVEGDLDQDPGFLRQLAQLGGGQSFVARAGAEIPALVLAEVRRKFGIPEGVARRVATKTSDARPAKTNEPPPKPKPNDPPPPKPPKPKKETPKPKPNHPTATVIGEPGSAVVEGIACAGLPAIGSFTSMDALEGAAVVLRRAEDKSVLLAARAAGAGSMAVLSIDERGGLDSWEGDPRIQQIAGRLMTAIGRPEPAREPAPDLRARVADGALLWQGGDAFGALPAWATEGAEELGTVRRKIVGDGIVGETERLDDGRRRTSLRIESQESPETRPAFEAALAALRGKGRAEGGAKSLTPERAIAGASPTAVALLLGAAAFAVAAAVAARRAD